MKLTMRNIATNTEPKLLPILLSLQISARFNLIYCNMYYKFYAPVIMMLRAVALPVRVQGRPCLKYIQSFTIISMATQRSCRWKCVLMVSLLSVVKTYGFYVNITYLESAVEKGAVCLDGSPPAYHWDVGFGLGINNWLIHIEGGGWCNNVTTCLTRSRTRLGSSTLMAEQVAFSGILSKQPQYNPDFYNWNRIKVRYCDGASFTGDVEEVNSTTKLHFRGARIFRAVIDDLLAKGMSNAKNAILSGCSAGGLTSILHCDNFKALLPPTTTVKCLADAGFFINSRDIFGTRRLEAFYDDVVKTHGSAKNLPQSCTSKMNNSLCLFPENMIQELKTPIFLINAAYDSWQIKNALAPGVVDPHGTWHNCKADIKRCSSYQIEIMQEFRMEFLHALDGFFGTSSPRGMFINSCYAHCQTEMQETWLMSDSPMLSNTTIGEAVGNWFYERSPFEEIDCPYPCDKTCHNRIFG